MRLNLVECLYGRRKQTLELLVMDGGEREDLEVEKLESTRLQDPRTMFNPADGPLGTKTTLPRPVNYNPLYLDVDSTSDDIDAVTSARTTPNCNPHPNLDVDCNSAWRVLRMERNSKRNFTALIT